MSKPGNYKQRRLHSNKLVKLSWNDILPSHKHSEKKCVGDIFKIPRVPIEKQQTIKESTIQKVCEKTRRNLANNKNETPVIRVMDASNWANLMFNSVEVALERGYVVGTDEIRAARDS